MTRGEGGRHWGSRLGAKEPPVLHILIHSIFGTRKGTNISVLNSFPSLPSSPRFRCGCPVFHLWPLNCHCHPTWGRGRSSWSGVGQGPRTRPGAQLGPLPSLSYGVPHRPFRCCVEEGRQAATPVGPRTVTRPGRAAQGGCGRRALAPAPGRLPHRVPPQQGSSFLSALLGDYSREASLPQT